MNGYGRLVIQIIYGTDDEEDKKGQLQDESDSLKIILRINGVKVDTQYFGYN